MKIHYAREEFLMGEFLPNIQSHGQRHLPLSRVDPSPAQPVLRHFLGWGSHRFPGNSIPGPHYFHSQKFLPIIPSNHALWKWEAVPRVLSVHALSNIQYLPSPSLRCLGISILQALQWLGMFGTS